MAEFVGIDRDLDEIEREIDSLEQKAVAELKDASRQLLDELFSRTPVWSGRTVRNYVFAVGGSPGGGEVEPIGGPGYQAGKGWRAQREGDPGPTSQMSLGSEPRRPENEAAARADMEGALSALQNLQDITVGNNSRNFDAVDAGEAPVPGRARNPGGVMILAHQALVAGRAEWWE